MQHQDWILHLRSSFCCWNFVRAVSELQSRVASHAFKFKCNRWRSRWWFCGWPSDQYNLRTFTLSYPRTHWKPSSQRIAEAPGHWPFWPQIYRLRGRGHRKESHEGWPELNFWAVWGPAECCDTTGFKGKFCRILCAYESGASLSCPTVCHQSSAMNLVSNPSKIIAYCCVCTHLVVRRRLSHWLIRHRRGEEGLLPWGGFWTRWPSTHPRHRPLRFRGSESFLECVRSTAFTPGWCSTARFHSGPARAVTQIFLNQNL